MRTCTVSRKSIQYLGQMDNQNPDWKGKKIYLFANSYTDDYTYMENALKDARSSVKNAKVEAGLFNQEIEKLDEWLIERHLK